MNEIIQKYFSNSHADDGNTFGAPAIIETIRQVETELGIEFPKDYVSFLLTTNGYEGAVGEAYVQLIEVDQIVEWTRLYGDDYIPWIIYIGSNGSSEMFVLDKRNSKLQFGVIPFIGEEQDFISLGETFEEFIGHLYNNDFWGD